MATPAAEIVNWAGAEETITLNGTTYTALAGTPYRVIAVLPGTTNSQVDYQRTALPTYVRKLGDPGSRHRHIERGTLVIRTAAAGGGTLLVEGTHYYVDYEDGWFRVFRTAGLSQSQTLYCTYDYRTPYVMNQDATDGTDGDFIVDFDDGTAQGIKRTTNSTIGDGGSVLVRYLKGQTAYLSTNTDAAPVTGLTYELTSIGGTHTGELQLHMEPFTEINWGQYASELHVYADPADRPGTRLYAGRISGAPTVAPQGFTVTVHAESLSRWLDVEVGQGEPAGKAYSGTITAVVLQLLRDHPDPHVKVDASLVGTFTATVAARWAETPLWTVLRELQIRAEADAGGDIVMGVRPDGKFYFQRQPTTGLAVLRHGTSGVVVSQRPTTHQPYTRVTLKKPSGSKYTYTHPDVTDPTKSLFGVIISHAMEAPSTIDDSGMSEFARGFVNRWSQDRVQLECQVFNDTAAHQPWDGHLEVRNQHGINMSGGTLPLQQTTAEWFGKDSWTRTYEVGTFDNREVLNRDRFRTGSEEVADGVATDNTFPAALDEAIAADATGTWHELDPDNSYATLADGRASATHGEAYNIGPGDAASGEKVMMHMPEGASSDPFFRRRVDDVTVTYQFQVWVDGTKRIDATATKAIDAFTALITTGTFHQVQIGSDTQPDITGQGEVFSYLASQGTSGSEPDGEVDFVSSGTDTSALSVGSSTSDATNKGILLNGTTEVRFAFDHQFDITDPTPGDPSGGSFDIQSGIVQGHVSNGTEILEVKSQIVRSVPLGTITNTVTLADVAGVFLLGTPRWDGAVTLPHRTTVELRIIPV